MKYRVWCHNKKEWEKDEVYLNSNGSLWQRYGNGLIPLSPETHIIQFCTGLKDKNDVLIYEGDILRGEETGDYGETLSIWHGVVMLNEEKHRLMIKDDIGDWYELDDFMFEDLAGNIHENPELLEVAK